MSTIAAEFIDLGTGLTMDRAEEAVARLAELSPQEAALVVDLSRCSFVQFGAGTRLANALSRWEPAGLEVRIPAPGDFSGGWFQNFTRSGLGLGIAAHASRITVDGVEITNEVCDYYAGRGMRQAQNHVFVPRLQDGDLVVSRDHLHHRLSELLRLVNVEEHAWTQNDRRSLSEICFEAIQNVGDHAFRSPWSRSWTEVSYLSLRYYRSLDQNDAAAGFMQRYLAYLDAVLPDDQAHIGFVEFVINDVGVGIAARHKQNDAIYELSLDAEGQVLLAALVDTASVKPHVPDITSTGDPGFGYTYIRDGLTRLHAYAELRSGRCLAYFNPAGDARSAFRLADRQYGLLPGTTLRVVVPVVSSQMQMLA